MGVCAAWFPFSLLLSALFWGSPNPCRALDCATHLSPNMTIDISVAISLGVGGSDPFLAANTEDCRIACCMEHNIQGNRDCNFFIYDARKLSRHPNCYLFNCPSLDSCPLKQSKGMMSYSLRPANSGTMREDSDLTDTRLHQLPISGKQNIQNSAISSQGSARKALDPVVHSQSSAGREIGSVVHSQGSAANKSGSAIHTQGSVGKILDEAEHSHISSAKKSSSESKKSHSGLDSEVPASEIQGSAGKKLNSESDTEHSANKDPDVVQSLITKQMLHLAQSIEKQLDQIVPEPDSDESITGLLPSDTKTSVRVEEEGALKHLPAEESKPSQTKQRMPQNGSVHKLIPTTKTPSTVPSTSGHKLQPSSAAVHQLPVTKENRTPGPDSQDVKVADNVPIPVGKNNKNVIHADYPSPVQTTTPKGHHVTSSKSQDFNMKDKTSFPPPPVTHSTPSNKKLKPTLLSIKSVAHSPNNHTNISSVTIKSFDKALSKPDLLANHDLSSDLAKKDASSVDPRKLDSTVKDESSHPDDKSGLFAALVFGVVFLVVVIALVSRKVAEARRRHRYTKLDYLINGMYVDT
ncbi:MANSC domain-containing protein 1 isoform 1-T2 [Rhinophrynus dorsalis]